MESLANKELELIDQLRENLRDLELCEEVLNNGNLIRWLKARNMVVEDAEIMYRNYVKWFDEIKLESIFRHEVPKAVSDVFVQPLVGFDYEGHPITVCPLGQMDFAKLMVEGYKDELVVQGVQLAERNSFFVRQLSIQRQLKNSIVQISTISDMEGLSWRQFTSSDVVQFIVTHAKCTEAYYPECVYKIIVINAPRIFTFFWAILKPFISEITQKKIQIYGTNRKEWEEALLKLAPKEAIPVKYGGTVPDDFDLLPKPHECAPKKRGSH